MLDFGVVVDGHRRRNIEHTDGKCGAVARALGVVPDEPSGVAAVVAIAVVDADTLAIGAGREAVRLGRRAVPQLPSNVKRSCGSGSVMLMVPLTVAMLPA